MEKSEISDRHANRIKQLVAEHEDCLYWVSVQIQHPRTQEDFYAIAGSGYETPTANRTWITILRDVYRRIDKKCRLYDYFLFGDFPYKGDGVYKIILGYGTDKPTMGVTPFGATISYPAQKQGFWDKYINPETSLNATNYETFSSYLSSNMGVTIDGRTNPITSENIETYLREDIEAIRCLSSNNHNDNNDLLIGSLLFPWQCLYYGSIKLMAKTAIQGGITIAAKKEIDNNLLNSLVAQLKEVSISWLWELSDQYRERYAIRSAIGSIMSRNGSHNIGSHVLAALSHNVGTMPEDRKLYQYIQHRMDYIATATTDFPVWRQPTMLVSDMMRTFLSQTHLLNYISGSEGLHAYQFQNPAIDSSSQHQTIKLHVRRVKEWVHESKEPKGKNSREVGKRIDERPIVYKDENNLGACIGIDDFVIYDKDNTSPNMPKLTDSNEDSTSNIQRPNHNPASFDKDLAVAIPGGVVGQHAFFTILENLIRNAAKHEWSKVEDKKNENLDVYVDFRDNPQEGLVEMLVWNDRVGKTTSGMMEIVERLTEKIERSFISPETGELVRENWGLAEMRISAGFLKHAEIDTIGGIGEKEGAAIDLVRPVVVRNGDKECLGFRFDFWKPKELLVVVPNAVEEDCIKSANGILSRFGIEMMRMGDALKSKGLAYSYVLIDGFDFKEAESKWPKLPFRVLSPTNYSAKGDNDDRAAHRVAFYDGDFYHTQSGEEFSEKIKRLIAEWNDGGNAKFFAHNLLEDVYACWVNHVRRARRVSKETLLIVDVAGDEGGSSKSLVTDSDLLHYVFEHSFNSAVRSYLDTIDRTRIRPEFAGAFYSLIMLDVKPIMSVDDFAKCHIPVGLTTMKDNEFKVVTQLKKLTNAALKRIPMDDDPTIDVNKSDAEHNCYVTTSWSKSLCNLKTIKCLSALYYGCDALCRGDSCSDVKEFVSYLCNVILGQARSFLSKYEERVVTLPPSFGILRQASDATTASNNEKKWNRQLGDRQQDNLVLTSFISSNRDKAMTMLSDAKKAQGDEAKGMCYLRHGDKDETKSNEVKNGSSKGSTEKRPESLRECSCYMEPLSGSQSYLSSLIALQHNVDYLSKVGSDERLSAIREMTGLVENALMRILLIDERATKFAKDHEEVAQIFKDIGIFVCDENNPAISGLANDYPQFNLLETSDANSNIGTAKDFEIVIIHQGIVDKILKTHTQERVVVFLRGLTDNVPYVVVTTGRGTPANIPDIARVLPFSIVESTLFKRYPEKMLLVDTIMNILPGKEGAK